MSSSKRFDGFDSHMLKMLKFHADDLERMTEFKKKIKEHRDKCTSMAFVLENSLNQGDSTNKIRSRELALYICTNAAQDKDNLFPGGIYRIGPDGLGQTTLTKESFLENLQTRRLAMLLWMDGASNIFHSVDEFNAWKNNIDAPFTFIFAASDDKEFPTSQKFLSELKSCNSSGTEVQTLTPSIVIEEGSSPSIASSSSYGSTYEAAIKLSPVARSNEEHSGIQLSDEEIAQALREAAMEHFTETASKGVSIFKDDGGIWVIVVRICEAKQLKKIFNAIHSRQAENVLNKALYKKVQSKHSESSNLSRRTANLFNKVLSKHSKSPEQQQQEDNHDFFTIDLEDSVSMYELGVLKIDTLNQEQIKVIKKTSDLPRFHVIGAAGTGKTFIGMYYVLKFFQDEETSTKSAAFVCPTLSLCLYFASWLLGRMELSTSEEENKILERMVFVVGDEEVIYRLKVKEEDDSLEEEELSDFDCNMEIGIVIVDEAHEKFMKMDTKSFIERNNKEEGMLSKIKRTFFQSTPQFEGVEISEVLHSILTARRDKKSTDVDDLKVILLSDLSQASATANQVVFPSFEEYRLREVTRCSKRIMLASKSFLPRSGGGDGEYAGRTPTCAHDTDGPMVISNLYEVEKGRDEIKLCQEKVCGEIDRIRKLFQGVEFVQTRLAIIVPKEESLDKFGRFDKVLKQHGLERVSAVEAMKHRKRRKYQHYCKKEKVVVDTIFNVKGLEFLFVILVDMDRPVSEDDPEVNKETQSWFFSGISRSHCHVSVVNKNIPGGFLNWLHSTRADEKEGDVSITDEDEKIDSTAITKLVIPSEPKEISSDDDSSDDSISSGSNSVPVPAITYNTTKSSIWNNVDSSANKDYRLENTRFNPLAAAAPFLENDGDLNKLCLRKEWEKVRNYVRFSSDSDDVKKERLMWKDDNGRNCLLWACGYGAPPETVLMMIGIGGRSLVVATENLGYTPLHIACTYGASLEVFEALLDVGGTELALMKTNGGRTALHWLCRRTSRHDDCVGAARALLVKGGRQLLHIKDNDGITAIDYAKAKNAPSDLIDFLSNY